MTAFFDSRWVPCPDHVREIGEGLPAGFRAAAAAAGIKSEGVLDVGLLVCDAPDTVMLSFSEPSFNETSSLAVNPAVSRTSARLMV